MIASSKLRSLNTGTDTSPRTKPSDIKPTLNPKISHILHTSRPHSPLTHQTRSPIIRRRKTNLNRPVLMTHIRQHDKRLNHHSTPMQQRRNGNSQSIHDHTRNLLIIAGIIQTRRHLTTRTTPKRAKPHHIPQIITMIPRHIPQLHITIHKPGRKHGNPHINTSHNNTPIND